MLINVLSGTALFWLKSWGDHRTELNHWSVSLPLRLAGQQWPITPHHEFPNSYFKRLADKIETKTEGKNAQYRPPPISRISSIFTQGSLSTFCPPAFWRSCLEMNKLRHIVDYLVTHWDFSLITCWRMQLSMLKTPLYGLLHAVNFFFKKNPNCCFGCIISLQNPLGVSLKVWLKVRRAVSTFLFVSGLEPNSKLISCENQTAQARLGISMTDVSK